MPLKSGSRTRTTGRKRAASRTKAGRARCAQVKRRCLKNRRKSKAKGPGSRIRKVYIVLTK